MKVERIKIGDQEIELSKLRTVIIAGNSMSIDLFINIMVVLDRFINSYNAHKIHIDGDNLIIEGNIT